MSKIELAYTVFYLYRSGVKFPSGAGVKSFSLKPTCSWGCVELSWVLTIAKFLKNRAASKLLLYYLLISIWQCSEGDLIVREMFRKILLIQFIGEKKLLRSVQLCLWRNINNNVCLLTSSKDKLSWECHTRGYKLS